VIKLRWSRQPNVRFHTVEWQLEDGSWEVAGTTSRCSILLTDLEPGKRFTFRVIGEQAAAGVPDAAIRESMSAHKGVVFQGMRRHDL